MYEDNKTRPFEYRLLTLCCRAKKCSCPDPPPSKNSTLVTWFIRMREVIKSSKHFKQEAKGLKADRDFATLQTFKSVL